MKLFKDIQDFITTKITLQNIKLFLVENRPSRNNFGWWALAGLLGICLYGFVYVGLVRLGIMLPIFYEGQYSRAQFFDPIILLINIVSSIFNPILGLFGISLPILEPSQPTEISRYYIIVRTLSNAAILTLQMSIISIVLGFVLALILATILVRPGSVFGLKWISQGYVDFFRSTPLLLQVFIVYFAPPQVIPGLNFGEFWGATIALALNTAAYQAEIIRGGIQAIPIGQTEAARGLGLTSGQTMLYVILPQALRIIIPPFTNEGINVILNSSLASVISVSELTRKARDLSATYLLALEVFMIAAVFYFVMTFSLSRLTRKFEEKYRIPGLGTHLTEKRR